MAKIEYSLFAEGECDEDAEVILPGHTKLSIYTKKKCPACGEIMWVKRGLNVCDRCIP